ncbi:glycosyltransferase family 25 protein [Acidisoma silvae]|uniref:Glycosyltransferase family 25 protein n=1 Tax=Acidisoma silvae TaxID=2802396 RepID=A0A964DZR2_9PROT|nr:glycosyltransferase family 25 protein [Acidisoma silvae]
MVSSIRVINLDSTPERFEQITAWNPGFPFERFSAVVGKDLDRDQCIHDGLITEDNTYTMGTVGCALSHITLWRQCAAGSQPFHIAEDDLILRADFQSMAQAKLNRLQDWDLVLWMHNFDWPLKVEPAVGLGPAIMQYDHATAVSRPDVFRQETTEPMLMRLLSAAAMGCYSISPKGAARMLADCLPVANQSADYVTQPGVTWFNTALDVEMNRHYHKWQAYVSVPPLAISPNDQSTSTIRGHMARMHNTATANRAVMPILSIAD